MATVAEMVSAVYEAWGAAVGDVYAGVVESVGHEAALLGAMQYAAEYSSERREEYAELARMLEAE